IPSPPKLYHRPLIIVPPAAPVNSGSREQAPDTTRSGVTGIRHSAPQGWLSPEADRLLADADLDRLRLRVLGLGNSNHQHAVLVDVSRQHLVPIGNLALRVERRRERVSEQLIHGIAERHIRLIRAASQGSNHQSTS